MAKAEHVTGLREIVRLLVRYLGVLERGEASCCGVTLAQCHIIGEIGRVGALSLNELAALLNLDKSTVSRSVDNLVHAGLVTREEHPADRRCVALRLSPEGRAVFADIEQRMAEYFGQVAVRLPPGKRAQVLESLQLLAAAVKDVRCCGDMAAKPDGKITRG